jgi:hypothetical protein
MIELSADLIAGLIISVCLLFAAWLIGGDDDEVSNAE